MPSIHDHPFDIVTADAERLINEKGATVWQKWSCVHCGSRQTMEIPNKFFTSGQCEECGESTDIKKNGCNYILMMEM